MPSDTEHDAFLLDTLLEPDDASKTRSTGTARETAYRNAFREVAMKANQVSPEVNDDSDSTLFAGLRAFGLPILAYALPSVRREKEEPAKVALSSSWGVALLRAIIHVVPVGASITLIVLNTRGLYAGKQESWNSILQFVAKALEMCMQASIAAVVFTYVRYEFAINGGMPFGALFAGLQVMQLSYLWSLEFWGTISTACLSRRRRAMFATFLAFSVLLAAVVGPSAAIALIPRPITVNAGISVIYLYNTSANDLYPTALTTDNLYADCRSATSVPYISQSCPHSDWLALPNLFGASAELIGFSSIRRLSLCLFSLQCVDTLATTPVPLISDNLAAGASLWSENYLSNGRSPEPWTTYDAHTAITQSAVARQPYVTTNCVVNNINGPEDARPISFSSQQSWRDLSGWQRTASLDQTEYHPKTANQRLFNSSTSRANVYQFAQAHPTGGIMWMELPASQYCNTSIGAIVVQPFYNGSQDYDDGYNLFGPQFAAACLVSAVWNSVTLNTTHDTNVSTGIPIQSTDFGNGYNEVSNWPVERIAISNQWASLFDAPIINLGWQAELYIPSSTASANVTVASTLIQAFAVNSMIDGASWGCVGLDTFDTSEEVGWTESNYCMLALNEGDRWINYEMMLSAMFATGIARSGLEKLQPQFTSTGVEFPSQGYLMEDLPQIGTGPDSPITQAYYDAPPFKIHMSTHVVGIGFDTAGVPIKLALAVLALYVAYALTHLTYLLAFAGWSSGSWDTIAEAVVLAWNSERSPKNLKHATAGVRGMELFKQPVSVLANDEKKDGIVMVFDDDEEIRRIMTKVAKDQEY